MEVNSSMNLLNLCRVCVQDVTDIPSENIFDSAGPDCPSIYIKLSAICSQVFATDSIEKPLADHAKALPPIVCSDCKSKIDEAYKLHQMCLEGNRKLWEWLMTPPETTIKEEYVEDVIQVEPTQLQMPEVFAESLDVLAEKSPAPPKRKSTTKGRVQKEVKKPRQIKCEKCRVMTIREHAMFKHMKLKHPDEALPCYKCKKVYFDKAKLEEHVLIHTTIKRHPCLNCQKLFKTAAELRIHVNVCTGQTPFLCTECGKAFSYAASLQMHRLQHKEKSYACDRCPSKFRQKGTLKTHMLTHTKERKFHCETCGVRFRLKNGLMQHQKTHTGEKPYGCDLCSMRFRDTASLRRHVRTHTGEKPFKCTHCDRAFAQTGDLAKHSRTHFGDNPYKCERCDAAFRLLADLRNHYKVHYQAGDNATGDQPDEIQFTIVSTLNRRAEQEKHRESHQVDQMLDERIELEMKQGAFDLDTSTTKDTENLESVSKPMVPGFESTMIQAILKLDGTNNAEPVKPVVSFAAATNSEPAFSGDATTGETVPFGVSQGTTPVLNLTKEKQPEPKKKDKTMEETKKDEPLPFKSSSASEQAAEPASPALRNLLQMVDSTTAETTEPPSPDTSTAIMAHGTGLFGSIKPPSNASRIAGLFSNFKFNTTETATTTTSTTSTLFGSVKPATTRANSSTGFSYGGTTFGTFGNKLTDLSVKSEPATSEATPLCATVASSAASSATITVSLIADPLWSRRF